MTTIYVITKDFIDRSGNLFQQDPVMKISNFETAKEVYQAYVDDLEDEMRTEINRHEVSYQDIENENVGFGYSILREVYDDDGDYVEAEDINSFSLTYNYVHYQMQRELEYQEEAEEE